jgi:hypothetical protein
MCGRAVGGRLALWPSRLHQAAFVTFYCVGGLIGIVTNAIFIVAVHPANDQLDKDFQCTRHWYWKVATGGAKPSSSQPLFSQQG